MLVQSLQKACSRRTFRQDNRKVLFLQTSGNLLHRRLEVTGMRVASVLLTMRQAASTRRTNGVMEQEKGRTRDDERIDTKRAPRVKNPALPGGAFVNQEGIFLRFATGCHSSPLFRAGHPGRSS